MKCAANPETVDRERVDAIAGLAEAEQQRRKAEESLFS
jgi:hypothetical protein